MAPLGLLLTACETTPKAPPPSTDIDETVLREHIRVLAADEFEGRKPGTPGEEKTVAYVTEQFRKLGLKPRQWRELSSAGAHGGEHGRARRRDVLHRPRRHPDAAALRQGRGHLEQARPAGGRTAAQRAGIRRLRHRRTGVRMGTTTPTPTCTARPFWCWSTIRDTAARTPRCSRAAP